MIIYFRAEVVEAAGATAALAVTLIIATFTSAALFSMCLLCPNCFICRTCRACSTCRNRASSTGKSNKALSLNSNPSLGAPATKGLSTIAVPFLEAHHCDSGAQHSSNSSVRKNKSRATWLYGKGDPSSLLWTKELQQAQELPLSFVAQ